MACQPITSATKFFEGVREWRAAAMLSSPMAHIGNIIGNTVNFALAPARSIVAGVLDIPTTTVLRLANPKVERDRFALEAAAQTYGFIKGLPVMLRDYTNSIRGLKEVQPGQLGPLSKLWTSKVFDALHREDKFFYNRAYAGSMWQQAYRQSVKEGTRGWGATMKRSGELMEEWALKGDQYHKAAVAEASAKALSGQANADEVNAVLKRLVATGGGPLKDAKQLAETAIFVANEGKALDTAVSSLEALDTQLSGAVSALLPFRRTPANVARESWRHSPLGIASAVVKAGQALEQGIPLTAIRGQLLDDFSKSVVGTSVMYGMYKAFDSGFLQWTPGYKGQNRAERLTREATGKFPNTLIVGGWAVPVERLDPIGALITTVGNSYAQYQSWLKDKDPSVLEAAQQGAEIASRNLAVNLTQWVEALTSLSDTFSSEPSLIQFAQRFGASFVPSPIKQARTVYGLVTGKEATTVNPVDTGLLAAAPLGAATALAPETVQAAGLGEEKLGLFGEPRKSRLPLVGRPVTPDPLVDEMERLTLYKDRPDVSLREVELNDGEKDIFARAKGSLQRRYMEQIFTTSGYRAAPDSIKKTLLDNAYKRAGRMIDQRVRLAKKFKRQLTAGELLRGLI